MKRISEDGGEGGITTHSVQGYKVDCSEATGLLTAFGGGSWLLAVASARRSVWQWIVVASSRGGVCSRHRLAVARGGVCSQRHLVVACGGVWWRLPLWRGKDSGRRD